MSLYARVVEQSGLPPASLAGGILDRAIAMHRQHIENPKSASAASQEKLMRFIVRARNALRRSPMTKRLGGHQS